MSLGFSLRKRAGAFSLDVELDTASRRLVLFGPSGSGKSLTLQCLSGLLTADSGTVRIGNRLLYDSDKQVNLPPERRHVGYVPQSYGLFPHLSVEQNVAYGLRHLPPSARAGRVRSLLSLVRLPGYEQRRPHQLSGGEQQRVSLARALATEPEVLLLDEPFSALDTPVRALLRQELLDLQAELGFAWVFVTHDLEEAYLLAEEIAVYSGGRILQFGPRDEVFYRPQSASIARLVGVNNLLAASWLDGQVIAEESGQLLAEGLPWVAQEGPDETSAGGRRCWACIRQEDIHVLRQDRPSGGLDAGIVMNGAITSERQLGFTVTMEFEVAAARGPLRLSVDLPVQAYRSLQISRGPRWQLFLPREAIHLVERRSGERA